MATPLTKAPEALLELGELRRREHAGEVGARLSNQRSASLSPLGARERPDPVTLRVEPPQDRPDTGDLIVRELEPLLHALEALLQARPAPVRSARRWRLRSRGTDGTDADQQGKGHRRDDTDLTHI
jgi:hypothetical protein